MKVSHIIYKVKDLHEAVEEFRKQGFTVEYGRTKNPYNAVIYFSQGPYLELLGSTGMPGIAKRMLRLLGNPKMADRMDFWDNYPSGCCGMHLENYASDLEQEKAALKKYNQKFFELSSVRKDTKGRALRCRCLFPDELGIPSMMTYFSIDPKPKNFVHPNGAVRIGNVFFGTESDYISLIQELCDDDFLHLFVSERPGDDIRFEFQFLSNTTEQQPGLELAGCMMQ